MRNRLQKARVNSEKSIRTLGWRGVRGELYILRMESRRAWSQGEEFRHGQWKALAKIFAPFW